ncbi:MAG: SocA family protein [Rikenellaceae bacterium]|jgi:uncharacterized phage-associated protein|nr:SocA family protein [Rikenellaceae bacterium]
MQPNKTKIVEALNYLASKQENHSLHTMKAYKLLWLADRYHVRQYGRTITHDDYYAMTHGVVPSVAKNILDNKGNMLKNHSNSIRLVNQYVYKTVSPCNRKVFSQTDIDVLDLIFEKFGHLTQQELSALSHEFPEWKRFEKLLHDFSQKSYKIKIEDFFTDYEEESGLFVDDDELLAITKELSSEMN